jgi:hypothetical protein
MTYRTELDRLDAARPAVLHRTEAVIDRDEEDRILARILDSDRATVDRTVERHSRSSIPPPRRAVGAAVAASLLVAAAVVFLMDGGRSPSTPHHHVSASGPSVPVQGSTMKLVNYTFALPSGFTSTIDPCAASGPGPATPVPVMEGFGAAASAEGGCVEALLTSSATIPSGAQPVAVGSYQGYMVSSGPSDESLYVTIPTAEGTRYLVLLAHGLTPDQVVTIAESAFPTSPAPDRTCATGCG